MKHVFEILLIFALFLQNFIVALFRRFFEAEKQNPQGFALLECMEISRLTFGLHEYCRTQVSDICYLK